MPITTCDDEMKEILREIAECRGQTEQRLENAEHKFVLLQQSVVEVLKVLTSCEDVGAGAASPSKRHFHVFVACLIAVTIATVYAWVETTSTVVA